MIGYIRKEGSENSFIDVVEEFITKVSQQYNYIDEGGLGVCVLNATVQRLRMMTM